MEKSRYVLKESNLGPVTAHSINPIATVMQANFNTRDRLSIYIDNNCLQQVCKSLDRNIDYKKLLAIFKKHTWLLHANYYVNLDEAQIYKPIMPLIEYLSYNGFSVNAQSDKLIDGKLDTFVGIRIVTDMLATASLNNVDHMVLFASHNVYHYPIEQLRRMGVKITVVGVKDRLTDKLRQVSDQFIDINHIMPAIELKK